MRRALGSCALGSLARVLAAVGSSGRKVKAFSMLTFSLWAALHLLAALGAEDQGGVGASAAQEQPCWPQAWPLGWLPGGAWLRGAESR